MVTVNVLRECWERVVLAHKEGLAFVSEWHKVLDVDAERHVPGVKWMQPTVSIVDDGSVSRTLITCTMFFEDDHEADRTNETRDNVYERMQVIAAQCLLMFRATFINDETMHEGVRLNVKQEGAANFTASFDSAGRQITGCMLTVTYADTTQICVDPYFNAI